LTSVHCNPAANGHVFGVAVVTVDPVAGDCVFRTTVPFKSNKRVHLHSLDEIQLTYEVQDRLSATSPIAKDIASALKFAGSLINSHMDGKRS